MEKVSGPHTKRPELSPELKVYILERLVKNLYHGKNIEWHFGLCGEEFDGEPNHLYGWIMISDLNDIDELPKLHDCCDDGLSQDLDAKAIPEEEEDLAKRYPYRACYNMDIWFNQDNYKEIENLKRRIANIEKGDN